jgi:DNA-binding NtrC family response regulator
LFVGTPCAKLTVNLISETEYHQSAEVNMEAAQKIIVVDDEKSICSNVEKILKKGNYEVVRAESADEALEKMAVDSFSLLISDIVMPGKTALSCLKPPRSSGR